MGKLTRGNGLLESFLAKKRAKKVDSLISRSHRKGRILDIGCGTTPYFLKNTRFKEKYGLDQLQTYSKKYGIHLKKHDVEEKARLPYRDNFFDCITLLAVFEHIKTKDLTFFLNEIHRILKPAGRFILTTPTPFANELLKIMALFNLVSKEEIHEHEKVYTSKEIRKEIKKAGFDDKYIKSGTFELFLNNWAHVDKKKR